MTFHVAGTGSRSLQTDTPEHKKAVMDWTKNKLVRTFVKYERDIMVTSGMAEGFDTAIAVAAIQLQIPLRLAIPNRGYGDYYWAKHSVTNRNRLRVFNNIVAAAQEVIYVNEAMGVNGLYHEGVHMNFWRNQWMVDNSDGFLVYDPNSRGTRDCMQRIIAAKKPFYVYK